MMVKAQDMDLPYLEFAEGAAPSTPASAVSRIYAKADGLMYSKDDAGTETLMSSGVATGIAATIMAAKGDILGATANDTPAVTTVGTNTHVLIADSAQSTGLRWGVSPGTLLAVVVNTSSGNDSTTSATQADVDAAAAAITFTAPASGNVLFRVTCNANMPNVNQNAFFGVREGTTNLVNGTTGTTVMQGQTAANSELTVCWTAYITGVSAGAHTYKLAYAVNGGATFTVRGSTSSPMTLEVWAA